MLKKKQKAKVRYIWKMCHIVKWKESQGSKLATNWLHMRLDFWLYA